MLRRRNVGWALNLSAVLLIAPVASVNPPAAAAAGGAPAVAAPRTCPRPAAAVLTQTPRTHPRTVALTFDDGPSRFTPAVLDVLKKERVRATFFVTGDHVRQHPDLARRIVREGHVVANHTATHPQRVAGSKPYGSFDRLPRSVQRDQMDATTRIIRQTTGVTPCFFRGPGGHHFGSTTLRLAKERRMAVVHWTVATGDSGQAGRLTAFWTRKIVRHGSVTHRHPILLMHDGKASLEPEQKVSSCRGNTTAALPGIIKHYKKRGYVFTDPQGRRL